MWFALFADSIVRKRKRFAAMCPLLPGAGVPAAWDGGLQHVIAILPSGGSAAMVVMCQHPVF